MSSAYAVNSTFKISFSLNSTDNAEFVRMPLDVCNIIAEYAVPIGLFEKNLSKIKQIGNYLAK